MDAFSQIVDCLKMLKRLKQTTLQFFYHYEFLKEDQIKGLSSEDIVTLFKEYDWSASS